MNIYIYTVPLTAVVQEVQKQLLVEEEERDASNQLARNQFYLNILVLVTATTAVFTIGAENTKIY
jgi:hypothetical protein